MLRALRLAAALGFLHLLHAAPSPSDWVPVRWPWSDAKSFELLADSPVNCLLLKQYNADLVTAASSRGLVVLALLTPADDPVAAARNAVAAKAAGIVLEGDFPAGAAARVREAAGALPVIELPSRARLDLTSRAPILGTWQGVWPGISVLDDGAKKSGPTGSVWIDTNTGFLRAVRAWTGATIWIANQPPGGLIVTGARYLQVIADAAMSDARWVIAFDRDFQKRLEKREADAMSDWKRMGALLRYFEAHPEWRHLRAYGKLAVVQDPEKGGLLSGGILDMIAVKHTPVRPIPRQQLSPDTLRGVTMAVNVDAESLTAEQKDTLRGVARNGGSLLTAPPGWRDRTPDPGKITLEKAELERINDIWREVNSMIGRRNLGVRLFNVASILSNLTSADDGRSAILQLVNYSDYPLEGVTLHFVGDYKRATLMTPDAPPKTLEIYKTDDGGGLDIDKVSVCATIRLEQ